MWTEWFTMGCWTWRNDKDDSLTITHRRLWDVDLNHVTKTSRETFEEAKAIADRYMQENP